MAAARNIEIPASTSIEAELARMKNKRGRSSALKITIVVLLVVAAVAVLLATTVFPVMRITGNSMSPTLTEGDIVITMKTDDVASGDVVALSLGTKTLIKRVIATGGQKVDIDAAGNVFVNGEYYREPYLTTSEKSLGECTISLPYTVPQGQYFIMGDNRAISQDSRTSYIGSITDEQISARVIFRIWPLFRFGLVQ